MYETKASALSPPPPPETSYTKPHKLVSKCYMSKVTHGPPSLPHYDVTLDAFLNETLLCTLTAIDVKLPISQVFV